MELSASPLLPSELPESLDPEVSAIEVLDSLSLEVLDVVSPPLLAEALDFPVDADIVVPAGPEPCPPPPVVSLKQPGPLRMPTTAHVRARWRAEGRRYEATTRGR